MTKKNRFYYFVLLETVQEACLQIQKALSKELTKDNGYKDDIEKDLITLENLKSIVFAVKTDIESKHVGASTELLLRIAANEFKNKLDNIPEEKLLKKEIIKNLKIVHKHILFNEM